MTTVCAEDLRPGDLVLFEVSSAYELVVQVGVFGTEFIEIMTLTTAGLMSMILAPRRRVSGIWVARKEDSNETTYQH